jgi:hypothetical protein
MTMPPNHALETSTDKRRTGFAVPRTRPSRRGCNRGVPQAGSPAGAGLGR